MLHGCRAGSSAAPDATTAPAPADSSTQPDGDLIDMGGEDTAASTQQPSDAGLKPPMPDAASLDATAATADTSSQPELDPPTDADGQPSAGALVDTAEPVPHPPVVLMGPSGVGKGTLVKRLMAEYGDKFAFTVSHTTRQPRPGEEDGVAYMFVDRAVMQVRCRLFASLCARVAQKVLLHGARVLLFCAAASRTLRA